MQSIEQSVRLARKYTLESNYDVAASMYSGVLSELDAYVMSLANADSRREWRVLRERIAEESSLVHTLQQELKSIYLPSPIGGSGMPASMADSVAQDGFSGGNVPFERLSTNEKLYGDRDRFGPHEGPQPLRTGKASQPLQRGKSGTRKIRRARTPVSSPSWESSSTSTARTLPRTATPAGTAYEPPRRNIVRKPLVVPPASDVRSSSAEGSTAADAKPVKGRGGKRAKKYVGRAGEDELITLIESDMHVGKSLASWTDIAGQEEAKRLLEEAVVYPVLMPDYYTGIRRPWRGVLLYGPPGTGKTMLAKAVASECNTTFFNISPATLTSKWRGDSEKLVRVLFEMARHYAPSTIFIDEIDALCGKRGGGDEHEATRRAKSVLLTQMDGIDAESSKIVMVLGATNHPWDIDEAMRRRLEKRIYIPLPNYQDRVKLLEITSGSLKLAPGVNFEKLSQMLENQNYSGADITNVVRDASMMTMRRYMHEIGKDELKQNGAEIGKRIADQPVTMEDFINAVKKVPSSIDSSQVPKFEKWKSEFEGNM